TPRPTPRPTPRGRRVSLGPTPRHGRTPRGRIAWSTENQAPGGDFRPRILLRPERLAARASFSARSSRRADPWGKSVKAGVVLGREGKTPSNRSNQTHTGD